ncbi:hypothetical protein SLS62_001284 [Diatrype stigma]|uniref:DUF4187 domain-containing protein n=1 Tax=Diatrype stigma TaxID=117547 RepID=A0AAN9V962_9PEZI
MAPPPEEEEEDDYMNMTFGDDAPGLATTVPSGGGSSSKGETSLQRRLRLKREGEARGRVKSKAELAAEAAAAREEALSRSLLEGDRARRSKGFAMMAKMGFKAGDTLGAAPAPAPAPAPAADITGTGTGSNGNGNSASAAATTIAGDAGGGRRHEPIRLQMKEDRGGIGLDSERKRKVQEAAEHQTKRVKADESDYRERMRREREVGRREGQFYGAMKVCERMDEERAQGQDGGIVGTGAEEASEGGNEQVKQKKKKGKTALSTRQLKSIPVEWRGLVRKRQESERDVRKMRYDLEQSSTTTLRLPTYADDLDDDDDKTAVGMTTGMGTEYVPVEEEDLEEGDDEELEAFSALEVEERLRRVVELLRREFRYCFWCKYQYPDEDMEGCPGSMEDDHD